MKIIRVIFALSFVMLATLFAQTKPAADLIINNANIWTVDHSLPKAQAVAVLGERIVSVGSNEEVAQWRGPQTRIIDAAGKLLLPGFNDAHTHFASGGFQLESVQLTDATVLKNLSGALPRKPGKCPKVN